MGDAADRPSQATCLIFRRPACCPLIGQPIFRAPLDYPRRCALPATLVGERMACGGAGGDGPNPRWLLHGPPSRDEAVERPCCTLRRSRPTQGAARALRVTT